MSNFAYTAFSNLQLSYNSVALFFCKGFRNILKLQKISKYWGLKDTGASYKLALASTDNCMQSIVRNIKNQSKLD